MCCEREIERRKKKYIFFAPILYRSRRQQFDFKSVLQRQLIRINFTHRADRIDRRETRNQPRNTVSSNRKPIYLEIESRAKIPIGVHNTHTNTNTHTHTYTRRHPATHAHLPSVHRDFCFGNIIFIRLNF